MMINLKTNYLGLELKNPIIIASSGLTGTVLKIIKLEEEGAGAVVIKSLFEEQIRMEAGDMTEGVQYPEAEDYIFNYTRSNTIDNYLKLIEEAKLKVKIPVIASINCLSSLEWITFAKEIQAAGADALELNVFFLPTSIHEHGTQYEQLYYDILNQIHKQISIPVAIKLGQHFSAIPSLVNNLYGRGAKGVVLFNRFYAPDIDIDTMGFTSTEVFSNPADIRFSLRWVGIVSSLVDKIDVCASTGIHDGKAIVKQLLAGAKAVQVCSTIYKNGTSQIGVMLKEMSEWMEKNNFESIDKFRGRMSYKNISDPAIFERAQFMKYFSNMQ